MGGICSDQPSTSQTLGDALPPPPPQTAAEDLPKTRLSPPQLGDGAVIRHPVKQIQAQIPAQGYIRLDPLLDLTLRRGCRTESPPGGISPAPPGRWADAHTPAVQVSGFHAHEREIQSGLQPPQEVILRHEILDGHCVEFELHSATAFPSYCSIIWGKRDFVNSSILCL